MRPILCVLVLLTACKKDGEGAFGPLPDAKVTYISEGEGEANLGPLEPARIGYWIYGDRSWQRWAGDLDAGRDDVRIKEVSGGNQLHSPTVGQGTALYRFTKDGLVIHTQDTPLDAKNLPVLMVPDTVRMGMVWESEYSDGDVNRMGVVAHETLMLPTGPAQIWGIAEYASDGTNLFIRTTRWYAEDVGRIGTGQAEPAWTPELGHDALVLPAEDQAHNEPALNPVRLVGAVPIEPHGEAGHEVFGFSGAVLDGKLCGYMDGEDPEIGFTKAAAHDYCVSLASPPQWGASGAPGCPTHVIRIPDPVVYTAYSEATVLIDNAAVLLPGVDYRLNLDGAGAVVDTVLTGWVVDGVPETLEYRASGYPAPWVHFHRDSDNPLGTVLVEAMPTRDAFLNDVVGEIWVGPARVQAGSPIHFAVIRRDGAVFSAMLKEGVLYGFVPVGVLPGATSILLDGDDRRVDAITTDGRVFELRVDQATGDVSIKAFGSVHVEEPGGAYEFKGVLLDPTHPGDVYVAAIATSARSVPEYRTGIYKAHFDKAPTPLVMPPSFHIGSFDVPGGTGVCWQPTSEPLEPTGWTWRGQSVDVVGTFGPADNCALVVTDPYVAADAAWVGAERAMEVNVPGVGRVSFGRPVRAAAHSLSGVDAMLPGGKILDALGSLFDGRGVLISYDAAGIIPAAGTGNTGIAHDLGGGGFWTWSRLPASPRNLRNVGGGGASAPPCSGQLYRCEFGGPVLGGGALSVRAPEDESGPEILVLGGDGTVAQVDAVQAAKAYAYSSRIRLEDGRICGLYEYISTVACVDPTGATTATVALGATHVRDPYEDAWWPLSDGTMLLLTEPAYRVDFSDMTVALFDPRLITLPVTAADGRVYGIARAYDAEFAEHFSLVELRPSGATDLRIVEKGTVPLPVKGAMLLGPSWIRVPR